MKTELSNNYSGTLLARVIYLLLCGTFFVLQGGQAHSYPEANDTEKADKDAWQVARWLGMGWNLGNQLDAIAEGVSNETVWGNRPVTQVTFDKLAAAGFTSVRIPVTWMGHIGSAPEYKLEESWLKRVEEVVGYAEKAGLNAIVNIHHDDNYWLSMKKAIQGEEQNEAIKAQLKAVWTQIAARFKDKGHFLLFEAMNEIHDGRWGWGDNRNDGGRQYAILNEWNQIFVNTVRATGGKNTDRYLCVPGYATNIELTLQSFVLPKDVVPGRLLVSVHCYDPMDYAMSNKYTEWGHTADAPKKVTGDNENQIASQFKALKEHFVEKGVPVYIGEMGCIHRATEREEAFRKYYLEYFYKAARTYGLAPFYWDDGGKGLCLLNHATGDWQPGALEAIGAMKKGLFTEDSSYTLQTVYEQAPR